MRIPVLQPTMYRLDHSMTYPKSMTYTENYVKQRSFLNGTEVYCIDVALLNSNWLLYPSWHSSFLLPPGIYHYHPPNVLAAIFCGSRYKIKPQGKLRKGRDCVIGAHCFHIDKVQSQLHPQRSSLTGCSITRLLSGLDTSQEGWGELRKPSLPLVQPSQ